MPGPKQECETTESRKVYTRLYKKLNAKCSRCPWHKVDNMRRKPSRHGSGKQNKRRDGRAARNPASHLSA